MTADLQTHSFWTAQSLGPGDWRLWEAGSLRLWTKRERQEWRIAVTRGEEREEIAVSQAEPPPPGATWQRWAFKQEDAVVSISPAMPERPVFVRRRGYRDPLPAPRPLHRLGHRSFPNHDRR